MVRLTRAALILSGVSAFAAIGAVAFSGLQWREQRSGGRQVDRQIAIAETQSRSAQIQAEASRVAALAARDQVQVSIQGLRINRHGVAVAEVQQAIQSADTARQLSNIHAEIQSIPTTLTEGSWADYKFAVINNSPGRVILRKLVQLPEIISQRSVDHFDEIKNKLRVAPIIRIVIQPGSAEGYSTSFGKINKEDVPLFQSGASTFRLIVASEVEDESGKIHHIYACEYAVKLETRDGHRMADCATPLPD